MSLLEEVEDELSEDVVEAAVFLATQDVGGMTGRFVEANPAAGRLPIPNIPIADLLRGNPDARKALLAYVQQLRKTAQVDEKL